MDKQKQVFKMAQQIREAYYKDGNMCLDEHLSVLYKNMENLAYAHGIVVYFDDNDIPEQVEDERL